MFIHKELLTRNARKRLAKYVMHWSSRTTAMTSPWCSKTLTTLRVVTSLIATARCFGTTRQRSPRGRTERVPGCCPSRRHDQHGQARSDVPAQGRAPPRGRRPQSSAIHRASTSSGIICHVLGQGVPVDKDKAVSLYEAAAAQGHELSSVELGRLLASQGPSRGHEALC
jgi:hypothetical protein